MYRADAPSAELDIEERLARAATARGFAVLAPRGKLGLCDWSTELAGWRCWPNTARQKPRAGELLVELGAHYRHTRARLHSRKVHPFVLGFSNGGFFAALIAAETKLDARGFAIAHGGPVEPASFDPARAVPTLLIAADGDRWQRPKMDTLHTLLDQAGWKHTYQTRGGEHALLDQDIQAALDFFAAVKHDTEVTSPDHPASSVGH